MQGLDARLGPDQKNSQPPPYIIFTYIDENYAGSQYKQQRNYNRKSTRNEEHENQDKGSHSINLPVARELIQVKCMTN